MPLLLEKVNANIHSKYYKINPDEFYSDMYELDCLGISSDMKNKLWDSYFEMLGEPSLLEKLINYIINKIDAIIIGIIITVLATIILKLIGIK